MNSAGWPAATDQYSYPQPHQAQSSYAPPYSNQPSFDHYDLQQPSYPPVSYTNSPYTTQPQYQHARPSDVFGPTSYNLDPALQSPTAFPPDSSFSFGLHGAENRNTIAPQSLQYQMASAQPLINPGVSNAAFQQPVTDFNRQPQDQSVLYFNHAQDGNMQNAENSIRYPELPSGSSDPEAKQSIKRFVATDDSSSAPTPAPRAQQVKVEVPQNTLRITHPELPAAKYPSSRPPFPYAPFLSWEDVPIQVAPGLKSQHQIPFNFSLPCIRACAYGQLDRYPSEVSSSEIEKWQRACSWIRYVSYVFFYALYFCVWQRLLFRRADSSLRCINSCTTIYQENQSTKGNKTFSQ